ncbi:MAG: hypothetical protein ACTSPI_01165 [Candidatus Heimdallarchaeaceae archaeon]
MSNFISVESVRRTCGIGSSEISDADVESIIDECEYQVERHYNTVFTPKEIIETREGNETKRLILRKNPVLTVRDLYIDGTQEDTANLIVSRGSGKIELNTSATVSTFQDGTQRNVIKYIFGWLEESSTSTTTDAASVAGTSVALSVASETDFSTNDWVDVYGMDGNHEAAQVTGTDTGEITVDQLVYGHVSGSKVVKLQINENFKKLMNYCCAIAMVARIVGQSYTDIVGYNIGEMRVQKGEPYTQWRETAVQLIKERDKILADIKPRPCVV